MEISPLIVLVLGMGTVFLGLFSIIILTKLMSSILGRNKKQEEVQKGQAPAVNAPAAPAAEPPKPAVCPIQDRGCFSAVIAAAIAAYTDTDAEGLRIRRITPLGAAPMPDADHGRFVAAVSAAIAETMGTDVSGLRIRSIRRISAALETDPDHGRFVAAVSAAIAEASGTDASGLRIRSIKRI